MPRLSEQLRKELYLESLKKRVRYLYIYGESHPSERELIAAKLDGFLEAGGLLQICGTDVLQKLIDDEHLSIFGMSRQERALRKEEMGPSDDADWSVYDAPSSERVAKRRKTRSYSTARKEKSYQVFGDQTAPKKATS